jgi:hypothetical protein
VNYIHNSINFHARLRIGAEEIKTHILTIEIQIAETLKKKTTALKSNQGKEVKHLLSPRTENPRVHIRIPIQEMENHTCNTQGSKVFYQLPIIGICPHSKQDFFRFHAAKIRKNQKPT